MPYYIYHVNDFPVRQLKKLEQQEVLTRAEHDLRKTSQEEVGRKNLATEDLGNRRLEEAERKAREEAEIKREKNQVTLQNGQNKLQNKADDQAAKDKAKADKEAKVLADINTARETEGFDKMNEIEQFNTLINHGVPIDAADKIAKLKSGFETRETNAVDKSYDAQKPFIDKITKAYEGWEVDTKPKLRLISKLATDEELVGPGGYTLLESMGLPLGILENPKAELLEKTSLDLLKGLPETYGNRILKVEVDNFLRTIPNLKNSAEGRRMIASNLLKLGEMKEVFFEEMRREQKRLLESKEKFPKDFEQSVFEQVKPRIDQINDEFIKMSDIKEIPKGTVPYFDPGGNIKFIPKNQEAWAQENGGKRIW